MTSSGLSTPRLARLRSALRRRVAAGAPALAVAGALIGAPVASAAPAATSAYEVYVWATGVNVRPCPQVSGVCPPIDGLRLGRQYVVAYCQALGGHVIDGPYENSYWVEIAVNGRVGWISAVYVRGGNNNEPVPGIPGPDSCV